MGKQFRHFGLEARCEIAHRREAGESLRQIGAALDCSASSVSRELKRNAAKHGYQPVYADEQAGIRRWHGSRLLRDAGLQCDVLEGLKQGWSPEQVSARLNGRISYESIYRFIAHQMARTNNYAWRHYLPRGKSRRGWHRHKGGSSVAHIQHRVSIHKRPKRVAKRKQPGHWEADLMLFSRCGQAVLTLHERSTRLTAVVALPTKAATAVVHTLHSLLAPLPPALRRTLTIDNGTEFAYHYSLHQSLGLKTYFCDPHSPWQKGGIENANGRLRRFLPRKTDLTTLTPQQIHHVAILYNHTPRKCLGFKTPAEAFAKVLHFNCESTQVPNAEGTILCIFRYQSFFEAMLGV